MLTSFEKILSRDGKLVYRTKGISMEPMLRQNRDLVIIRVPGSRQKKYDVALYRRGGNYILHRVIRVCDDHYLIRGDNTYALETVPDTAVISVLDSFHRKGKQYKTTDRTYRLYSRFWNHIYPLRALGFRGRRLAVRIARKLHILPWIRRMRL